MGTQVSARMTLAVDEPAELVFSVAAAQGGEVRTERVTCLSYDLPIAMDEVSGPCGARLHVVRAPVGPLTFAYEASLGSSAPASPPTEAERILYRRPSRYAESDRLEITARDAFGGLEGQALVDAVAGWVHSRIGYVPGSSTSGDGALDTFLGRQGVCRDFAHLVVALCRARNVPARVVSMYAPGLEPMDFHAVAEVCVDGRWQLVDATWLAPRPSLVRIATGRDAADTAFLTQHSGATRFGDLLVTASVDGDLPSDDWTAPVWS